MSRSKKDGKRRGAHVHWLRWNGEWGTRRPPGGWVSPGRWTKWLTHRLERRIARQEIEQEIRNV